MCKHWKSRYQTVAEHLQLYMTMSPLSDSTDIHNKDIHSPLSMLQTMLSACFAAVDRHQTRRARISKPKFFRRLQVRIMPGFGRVKWGKALQSDCVINVATTRCFNTGDRMEIRVKAVHSECEGKRKGRKTDFTTQTPNKMRQAVTPRKKLSETFPCNTKHMVDNGEGGNER